MLVAGGYAKSVALLAVGQVLTGFSSFSVIFLAFLIPTEYCEEQHRQRLVVTINYSWYC